MTCQVSHGRDERDAQSPERALPDEVPGSNRSMPAAQLNR
jgi:hypothetical protein